MRNFDQYSEKRLYWILHTLGWSSLIFIETVNYTFFIIGEFKWEFVVQFFILSAVGFIVSHFYKKWFIPKSLFEKGLSKIWIKGILDVLGISFLMVSALYGIPLLFQGFEGISTTTFWISFFGQLMNLSRYVMGWVVIYYLYHLMKHTQDVLEQKLVLENLAKSTELELLKNQLNPHFLFNALNSIKALVLLDQEKARDSIIKLSELLRFTLNYEKAALIALRDELKEVEKYLQLEQIRFGKRLQVEIQVDEEVLESKVPPAMILTLAENAIKHGITQLPDGGLIKVNCSKKKGRLEIKVSNTGVLKENVTLGIGLQNVRKRIHSLFGEEGDLSLYSPISNEVAAVISYPIA